MRHLRVARLFRRPDRLTCSHAKPVVCGAGRCVFVLAEAGARRDCTDAYGRSSARLPVRLPPRRPHRRSRFVAADTPWSDTDGNTFIVPDGWRIYVHARHDDRGRGARGRFAHRAHRRVRSDERSRARCRVERLQARCEVAADHAARAPDRDGWSKVTHYGYHTSPNEKRDVQAATFRERHAGPCSSSIRRQATGEKRGGAGRPRSSASLLPKGYARESFAGQDRTKLDAARGSPQLTAFVERRREARPACPAWRSA